jgi:hypothetical protein
MKIIRSVNLYLAIAGLALALVSGGCATVPKAERYVEPPIGTMYTVSQTSTGSYGSGTSQITTKVTERMWEGKRVIAFESPTLVVLANDLGFLAMLAPDGKPIVSWDPPIGFDWPLEVGKTWTNSYRMTVHATKQTIPFENISKVEAYEDVVGAAGTFKAFKVSSSDTLGTENVVWFSSELGIYVKQINKRTAKNPSGPGTREQEIVSQTIRK